MIVITAAAAYHYSGDNLFCTLRSGQRCYTKENREVIYQAIVKYGQSMAKFYENNIFEHLPHWEF